MQRSIPLRVFSPCRFLFSGLVATLLATAVAAQVPPPAEQVAAALQAAPEELRDRASVLGYDGAGALQTLRDGDNELICLADDPQTDGFSVACYHRSLEPYMARGRELAAEGVAPVERNQRRWQETADGKLPMPEQPAMLYVLTGSGFDAEAGTVADSYLRWVVYVPYATGESTGLTEERVPNVPWLMFPGTAGAHIMISPPRDGD